MMPDTMTLAHFKYIYLLYIYIYIFILLFLIEKPHNIISYIGLRRHTSFYIRGLVELLFEVEGGCDSFARWHR